MCKEGGLMDIEHIAMIAFGICVAVSYVIFYRLYMGLLRQHELMQEKFMARDYSEYKVMVNQGQGGVSTQPDDVGPSVSMSDEDEWKIWVAREQKNMTDFMQEVAGGGTAES